MRKRAFGLGLCVAIAVPAYVGASWDSAVKLKSDPTSDSKPSTDQYQPPTAARQLNEMITEHNVHQFQDALTVNALEQLAAAQAAQAATAAANDANASSSSSNYSSSSPTPVTPTAPAAPVTSSGGIPPAWMPTAICEEGGSNDPNYGYFGIKEWNGFDGYPTAGSAPLSVQLAWESANGITTPPDAPGQCHSY